MISRLIPGRSIGTMASAGLAAMALTFAMASFVVQAQPVSKEEEAKRRLQQQQHKSVPPPKQGGQPHQGPLPGQGQQRSSSQGPVGQKQILKQVQPQPKFVPPTTPRVTTQPTVPTKPPLTTTTPVTPLNSQTHSQPKFLPPGTPTKPPLTTTTPLNSQSKAQPKFVAPGTPSNGVVTPGPGPRRIDDVRSARVRSNGPGGQTVIQEPGNRTIVKQGNAAFITHNETAAVQRFVPAAKSSPRQGGGTRTVYSRPGGAQIFNDVDANGHLLRRYRRDASGREIVLLDNRRFYRNLAIGAGIAVIATAAYVALAPPAFAFPRNRYIVDYDHASYDDCYETLIAPPVEAIEPIYSLEQIRYSEPLRARMRRIDLDNITFEFGSFDVPPDQYAKLDNIARALGRVIERDPAEVFLIEGHTDAVGTDEDNLSLSDRRAEAVARILVETYAIPAENIVTQGYGRQFLKIDTTGPERANRRVAVRRITPLLARGEQ